MDSAVGKLSCIYSTSNKLHSKKKAVQCYITNGLSGCGKSYISEKYIIQKSAIRLRSDVERKRAFANTKKSVLYSPDSTLKTYQLLVTLSQNILSSGFNVIVDATFLQKYQRALFIQLCSKLLVPLTILAIHSDEKTMVKRIKQRLNACIDVSDADTAILKSQIKSQQPLSDEELSMTIHVNN